MSNRLEDKKSRKKQKVKKRKSQKGKKSKSLKDQKSKRQKSQKGKKSKRQKVESGFASNTHSKPLHRQKVKRQNEDMILNLQSRPGKLSLLPTLNQSPCQSKNMFCIHILTILCCMFFH